MGDYEKIQETRKRAAEINAEAAAIESNNDRMKSVIREGLALLEDGKSACNDPRQWAEWCKRADAFCERNQE